MRKKIRGIIIAPETRSWIKRLTQDEKWDLMDAIYAYNIDWEIIEMNDKVWICFDMMKEFFDIQIENYEEKSRINKENISKRYEKENGIRNDTTVHDGIRNDTTVHNKVNKNKEKENKENKNKKEKEYTLEEFIISRKEMTYSKWFFQRVLESGIKILHPLTDTFWDNFDKNIKKIKEEQNLDLDYIEAETNKFINWHSDNRSEFKSTTWRINTWFNRK